MRVQRIWRLGACLLAVVVIASAAERRQVLVADVVAQEQTRPTFIDEKVLRLLPDDVATTMVRYDKNLEYYASSHLKEKGPLPARASLRFKEMIPVTPDMLKSKAPKVNHQMAPSRTEPETASLDPDSGYPDSDKAMVAATLVPSLKKSEEEQQPTFFSKTDAESRVEDAFETARFKSNRPNVDDILSSLPSMPHDPVLLQQQATVRAHAAAESQTQAQAQAQAQTMQQQADVALGSDLLDEDMDDDITPAQMAVDEMAMHQRQLLQQQKPRAPTAVPAVPSENFRFRSKHRLPDSILRARLERARVRRAEDGRDRAGPQMPESFADNQSPALVEQRSRITAQRSQAFGGENEDDAEAVPQAPAFEPAPAAPAVAAPVPSNPFGLREEEYVPPAPGLLL